MGHQLQNSRGRLVLQLTTEQPKKACFTTNYKTTEADLLQNLLIKGRRLVVMVDSQSCSSSYQTRALGASDEEKEEVGAPELVSTCWDRPEANSYPESNISTPKKLSSRGLASCLQWRRRLPLISQLLPSTSLHFLPFPLQPTPAHSWLAFGG